MKNNKRRITEVERNLLSYTPLCYWLLRMAGGITSLPRTFGALIVNALQSRVTNMVAHVDKPKQLLIGKTRCLFILHTMISLSP